MGLNDLPTALRAPIDFCAIPTPLGLAAVGNIVERQHCHVAAQLDFGPDQFISIDLLRIM